MDVVTGRKKVRNNKVVSLLKILKEQECPLNKEYGGLFTGGGYTAETEYELGAQAIAEAAHCILGSLQRGWAYIEQDKVDLKQAMRYEEAHLKEEIGIIRRTVKEKSRDLYIEQINKPFKDIRPEFLNNPEWKREYFSHIEKSIKSLKENSPRLRRKAEQLSDELMYTKKKLPEEIFYIAAFAYEIVIKLTLAMEESVKDWPNKEMTNGFLDKDLENTINVTYKLIEKMYRSFV